MMINWNKASDEREKTYHHETDPKMNQNGKAWNGISIYFSEINQKPEYDL